MTRPHSPVKSLFATGFQDVRVEVERMSWSLSFRERPAVATINFVGLKGSTKDVIVKALKKQESPKAF